ncbi:MAG TPA: SPOR domain-containing protein [Saprospiraceae bacterium]|nr:SPOR domain-containing protein [Saprospiraceae bacterium]
MKTVNQESTNLTAMLLKQLVLLLIVLLVCITEGKGQIVEQTQVTDLIERWKIHNMENKEVRGFRVQILATTDRRQMETVQREFERKYPDYPVHFAHNEPYWYLKTGAFITNQKAQAFMKQMSKEYPASLIVSDMIKGEELLLYDQ